jgi:hypothetical protein
MPMELTLLTSFHKYYLTRDLVKMVILAGDVAL